MPNWCHNNLLVSGPKDKLKEFIENSRGEDGGKEQPLLFYEAVPEPDWDTPDAPRYTFAEANLPEEVLNKIPEPEEENKNALDSEESSEEISPILTSAQEEEPVEPDFHDAMGAIS